MSGVSFGAFDEEDWRFILSLCDSGVQRAFEESAPPFTAECKARRAKLDAFTKSTFDKHRPMAAQHDHEVDREQAVHEKRAEGETRGEGGDGPEDDSSASGQSLQGDVGISRDHRTP